MILYLRDIKRMEEVRLHILDHISDELDRASLSRIFGISGATLDRHFFYCNKVTLPKFVRMERMKKAQSLLQTRSLSIGEVASMVGFKEVSHFSHAFTLHFGKSPMSFMKDDDKEEGDE